MDNTETLSPLVIVINSKKEFEYFRDRSLNDKQLRDIEKVELKLNQGIQLGSNFIQNPSDSDKALFLAMQLISSIEQNDDQKIALICAYLATRYPQLKQIKISRRDDDLSIELINDKTFIDQTPIKFIARKDLD